MSRRTRTAIALVVVLAGSGACSGGSSASRAGGDESRTDRTTTSAPAPVEAVLLPAEGPLQAGTYAVPGFVPMPTIELDAGWTVISRTEGALTLAFRFDPEGRELARLNLAEVTGAFDAPFIEPEVIMSPPLQQARVRPLPKGGLPAALAALPGVTLSETAEIEVAGVEATRFTANVGELPAEAKEKCPQIPSGCVAAYDLPGPMAAVFPGGTSHDLTTFTVGDQTYLGAVASPADGAPAGFEDAAETVIRSVSFDRRVVLDEQASRELYMAGVADLQVRPLARSVAAPGSPAATFMAALDHDRTTQVLAERDVPARQVTTTGDKVTLSGGPGPDDDYEAFTFDQGRVASFKVRGTPISEFVVAIDDPETVRVGPLQVTPLEAYKSFASGMLWVPVRAVNGPAPADLSTLTVDHVAPDGTSRPTAFPFDGIVVAPHWDAPYTLLFEDAPLGGKLVFGGTVNGQAVDATVELPTPG